MPRRFAKLTHALLWLWLCATAAAGADEAAILADLRAFFQTDDPARREELARRVESDPGYDRASVSGWLHRTDIFEPLSPGPTRIRVAIDDGSTLAITIRVPNAYDHRRPYPLLYCLHGLRGNADGIINYVEHQLGDEIEQYLVAAPTGYRQVVVHSTTPPSSEHAAVLQAVKRAVHVDSDRVFALGYSRGGHTAWTLAMLHPDEFAGVVPVAGTLLLPGGADLFETFLPNIANTRVFACWGENDLMSADDVTPSEDGGIAGLNRKLGILAASRQLPLTWFEHPDKGHGDIDVPRTDLDQLLTATREHYPRSVRHVFRLVHQGRTPWIEAHTWRGSWWDDQPLELSFRGDEDSLDPEVQRQATVRAIRGRLGELRGEINGQEINVYRKKISELTVWIGDGMIDWTKPVSLKVNGRKAFDGQLTPDLLVCLTQAARTHDLDRLRWAGLRFKSGSRTRVVTGQTQFPTPPVTPKGPLSPGAEQPVIPRSEATRNLTPPPATGLREGAARQALLVRARPPDVWHARAEGAGMCLSP